MNRNPWHRVYMLLQFVLWLNIAYLLVGVVVSLPFEQTYTLGNIPVDHNTKKIFVVLPLCIFAQPLARLVSTWFLYCCIPEARKAYQQGLIGPRGMDVNEMMKRNFKQVLVTGIIALPIAIIASFMLPL